MGYTNIKTNFKNNNALTQLITLGNNFMKINKKKPYNNK